MQIVARLRTELRDLVELIIAPSVAALMPWRMACALMYRVVARTSLYRKAAEEAWREFSARPAHGLLSPESELDARHWMARRAFVTWVDHADHYLARTRSDTWLQRNLRLVEGQWPPRNTRALLLTFHWGAGMWGLRHAARHGLIPRALVASTSGDPFRGRSVLAWYARSRTLSVEKALRCQPLDVTASLRPAIQTLRNDGQILAAVDVPADQAVASMEVKILGMKASIPRALYRLAVDHHVPVYVYVTGIDSDTGMRTLKIHDLGVNTDIDVLVASVFRLLETAVLCDSAAWHFWSEAPRLFKNDCSSP